MKRLGMVEMKPVAIHLGEKYERRFQGGHLSRQGFMGYMYEVCNFSHGVRTVRQIARALSHELEPISVEEVYEICKDLERLGYMTVHETPPTKT
ncbi:MAG: hypothetical protein ACRDGN_01430 [bacterium]